MVTVNRSKLGIYTAEYNFANEDNGETSPTDWTNEDEGTQTSSIYNEYEEHAKIIGQKINEQSDNQAILSLNFAGAKTDGIVELYHDHTPNDTYTSYRLMSAANHVICEMYCHYNSRNIYDQFAGNLLGTSVGTGMCHLAMCFNNSGAPKDVGDGSVLADGKARFYIRGVLIGDYNLQNAENATYFQIYTGSSPP